MKMEIDFPQSNWFEIGEKVWYMCQNVPRSSKVYGTHIRLLGKWSPEHEFIGVGASVEYSLETGTYRASKVFPDKEALLASL